MFRAAFFVTALALVACRPEKGPQGPTPGEQPLPPASGTAIGYLIDNSGSLELKDNQLRELQRLDASLAARNDAIDTQLREIERPEEMAPPDKHETELKPNNWAPGAMATRTTADSGKLHENRAANVKDALNKAWAVLDAKQQEAATKLLADRGITAPPLLTPGTGGNIPNAALPDATGSDSNEEQATPRDEP